MRKFIFFWFLAVGLISLIGAVWIGRSMKLTATGFYEPDVADGAAETVVHDTAEMVAHALNNGGGTPPPEPRRTPQPQTKDPLFLCDPRLHRTPPRARPPPI